MPVLSSALLATLLSLSASATMAPADPCALRSFVDRADPIAGSKDSEAAQPASAQVASLMGKAEGRGKACLTVVYAGLLAREGKHAQAAGHYAEAAHALPEIEGALALAEQRHARLAKERSSGSSKPAAATKPTPAPANAEEAAAEIMKLVREAKPQKAVAVALAFPRKGPPHAKLEAATLTALVRAGRTDEAVARARALPTGDAFVEARAWTLGKAGDLRAARDAYTALAQSTRDPALRAEATFLAAFAAYEGATAADELDEAQQAFSQSLPVVAGTSWETAARWYLALTEMLRGRHAQAEKVLAALVKDMPSDREVSKHRYWLARARIAAGDAAGGKAELASLARQEPLDFYGMLAKRRLGQKPVRGANVPAQALTRKARDDAEAQKVLLLWNLGLDEQARVHARGLGASVADIGLQHRIDDAHFGWRRGARFMPVPRVRSGALVQDDRWRVSYAAPWWASVREAARRHGVSPSFIYAIMRTESGFDSGAVSVAGARGALQLLPSAARGAATLAGRELKDADAIFQAPVAIDLGAALLGAGKKDFGSMLLSAAAYNGGAPHVATWMKRYGDLEVELFIERIPFKETRDYVKRVLATEAMYRALDGGTLSLELPASIPKPPAAFTHFPMDE